MSQVFVHPAFTTTETPRGWLHVASPELSAIDWENALTAARTCLRVPHPGILEVLEVNATGILTRASPLSSLATLITRAGALEPEPLLSWFPRIADALAHLSAHGATPSLETQSVFAADGATPQLLGFTPAATAQVRQLSALFYECLKGMPLPSNPTPSDWIGVKPRLADVLTRALDGQPPTPAQLATALRALGTGDTAGYLARPEARQHDTLMSPSRRGELVGAYELEELIGSGGMGEVYLARHVRLSRRVALKFLRPELASQLDVVQRFFEEARVVNEINHPHIVQVLDFVEEPGRVYCVMELLRGKTLAQLAADEGPLPLKRLSMLGIQVCQALQAAHALGVVHRDIKPENIFVTRAADGSDFVKVLDFGIAKQLRAPGQTQKGHVMGTPIYMPPEQAQGKPVDARADLYAFGVVLWEQLSGQSFEKVAGSPPLLQTSASKETIPPELASLIAACLKMDPAARPASVRELEQALQLPAPRLAPKRPVLIVIGAVALGAAAFVFWPSTPEAPLLLPPPPPTPVVIAQPPPVVVVEEQPKPIAPPPIVKPARVDPFVKRVARLRTEYERLTTVHGAEQLTSLEREAFRQAIAEYGAGPTPSYRSTLEGAEQALASAKTRLER